MMRELFPRLLADDRKKLSERLDSHNPSTHIGTSWELAVVWSLSKKLNAKLYISATHTKKRPDAEVDLQLDRPIMIEIKSLSGDAYRFEDHLKRSTENISALWDLLKPDILGAVDVRYHEWRTKITYAPRQPAVVEDPRTNPKFVEALKEFLIGPEKITTLIIPKTIHATFRKTSNVFPKYTCDIPELIQNIRNSQSSNAIKGGRNQLLPFQDSHYLGMLLCDGGNQNFSEPERFTPLNVASTTAMMNHIVDRAGLDFVLTLGVQDSRAPISSFANMSDRRERAIVCHFFPDPALPTDVAELIRSELSEALATIPLPRMQPYQVRSYTKSIAQRKSLPPTYSAATFAMQRGKGMVMRISANALVDLMTGELPQANFGELHCITNTQLTLKGRKIKSIKFESRGSDFDDDYVVFEFEHNEANTSFSAIAKTIET